MKRILLVLSGFIALTFACFAQDVIVTKNGARINASVLRINDDNVMFKYFDNPNGSTYSISKNSVSQIYYQNGQVESFEINARQQTNTPVQTQSQPRQSQTNTPDIITMNSGNVINAIVRKITPAQVQFNLLTEPNGKLYYVNKSDVSTILYRDGRTENFAVAYTETPANRQRASQPVAQSQQESAISRNTYNQYRDLPSFTDKSSKFNKAGTWLIVGGSVFVAGGLVLYAMEAAHSGQKGYIGNTPLSNIANTGIIIGGITVAGGVTCKIISGNLKKKSVSAYNQTSSNYEYSMNVGLVGNGIGLCVNF